MFWLLKNLLIIPNGHLVMLTLNSHALLNDFDGSITSTKSAKDQLNSKKKLNLNAIRRTQVCKVLLKWVKTNTLKQNKSQDQKDENKRKYSIWRFLGSQ